MNEHNPIENEIFSSIRLQDRAKEQLKALHLLVAQGYTVLDLEGQIINKHNINNLKMRMLDNKK